MNCEPVQRVLDAYLDNELDPATHAQVQEHLRGCSTCLPLHAEREALRTGLRRLARHEAPAPLRAALAHRLDLEEASSAPRPDQAPSGRRWLRGSALVHAVRGLRPALWAGAGVLAGLLLGPWVSQPQIARDTREPVIAQHVASFADGAPRIEVGSADRHMVKPWFAGKLDFAPTVRDLSEAGFTLVGGRLDTVSSQPAAVLVYRLRRHQISLFVSRAPGEAARPMVVSTLRGFAVATWVHDGLAHSAVSDVDARDLQRFAELVVGAARQ